MGFKEELIKAGFSESEAVKLSSDEYFSSNYKAKNAEQLKGLVEKIAGVYAVKPEKIRKAILSYPPFAGYDHERVLRQKSRLGKVVGLSEREVVDLILEKPQLAGFSTQRDIAALDVAREALRELSEKRPVTLEDRQLLLKTYISVYRKSPYVSREGFGTSERLRLSQARKLKLTFTEPDMLKFFRKKLGLPQ